MYLTILISLVLIKTAKLGCGQKRRRARTEEESNRKSEKKREKEKKLSETYIDTCTKNLKERKSNTYIYLYINVCCGVHEDGRQNPNNKA